MAPRRGRCRELTGRAPARALARRRPLGAILLSERALVLSGSRLGAGNFSAQIGVDSERNEPFGA